MVGLLEIDIAMWGIKTLKANRFFAWTVLLSAIFFIVWTLFEWFFNSYLSFDESGQFFMSKGLNHYSAPYSSEGTLLDALRENRFYNLDPGGFTFLLWFWSSVSDHVVWLRLLPFFFYLAAIVGVYRLLAFYVSDKIWRVAITVLLLGINLVALLMAPLLRAYSMEVCGCVWTLFFLHRLSEKNTIGNFFLLSLFLSFFCTSRYGFVLFAFGVALYVLAWIFKHNERQNALLKALVFGLPTLMTVVAIFLVETQYQNAQATCPSYLSTLRSNPLFMVVYPLSWIVYASVVCVILRYKKTRRFPALYVITLIEIAIYALCSLLDIYPWNMQRSISLMLSCLLVVSVEFYYGWGKNQMVMMAGAVLLLFAALFIAFSSTVRKYPQLNITQGNEVGELVSYMRQHKKDTCFVEAIYVPDVRFLYEYGIRKDSAAEEGYPDRYVFQNGDPSDGNDSQREYIGPYFDETTCDVMVHAAFQNVFNKRDTSIDVQRPEEYELVPGCQYLWRKKANLNQ